VSARLGSPRLHHRETDSTSDRARALALAGAPHGTLVTAGAQRGGRGRQGRIWSAPPGRALLMSLVLRDWPALLPIVGAVAVADVAAARGGAISIKWPNDVLLDGRKLSGILAGLNVAVRTADLPDDVRDRAATLGLEPDTIEPMLAALLDALARRLAQPTPDVLADYRARDALAGHRVCWARGEGVARGIDDCGRLLVERADGSREELDAGEVHLLADVEN